jgi:hypothetical protein
VYQWTTVKYILFVHFQIDSIFRNIFTYLALAVIAFASSALSPFLNIQLLSKSDSGWVHNSNLK